jgi:hypothetical protein
MFPPVDPRHGLPTGRLQTFGNQSFQHHIAGGVEQVGADFSFEWRKVDAISSSRQEAGKVGLAQVQRKLSQIVAFQDKDIEGVELDLVVVLSAVQSVEVGDPVHSKEHGLTIKDELLGPDAAGSLNDQRIAAAPIVTVAGEQPDLVSIARDDEAEAILLDLMNPVGM